MPDFQPTPATPIPHTPGPWKVIRLDDEWYINPDRETGEYSLIARVHKRSHHCHANARLLAAAPDLLGACQQIDEWFDVVAQNHPEMLRPFEAVRQAIAKTKPQT